MTPIEKLIPDTEEYINIIEERIKINSYNDLCGLTHGCYYNFEIDCDNCKFISDFSSEEYNRITENNTKVPTIKELRETYIKITLLG
tara:strand:+ start:20628 stop:20888 length:261 start_codon:yes stop_codon:yes gene_type:complete